MLLVFKSLSLVLQIILYCIKVKIKSDLVLLFVRLFNERASCNRPQSLLKRVSRKQNKLLRKFFLHKLIHDHSCKFIFPSRKYIQHVNRLLFKFPCLIGKTRLSFQYFKTNYVFEICIKNENIFSYFIKKKYFEMVLFSGNQ